MVFRRTARAAARWGWLSTVCAAAFLLGSAPGARADTLGTFSVLTYNVAGLPLGFSGSNPEVNNALMSPLFNSYDLVAVQEDFGFHDDLTSQATHPHRSIKDTTDTPIIIQFVEPDPGLGDGLNRLSTFEFEGHARVTWDECFGDFTNGNDCLAPKGFSVARHELAPGAFVDVYNWHADAKDELEDKEVRRSQVRQLYAYIQANSAGRAVLVLGDTNSRYTREGDILPEMLAATGLSDVWVDLTLGEAPAQGPKLDACVENGQSGGDCEQVDKIFYRNGGGVTLVPIAYDVPVATFVDGMGLPLSDHEPVSAVFQWALPEPGPAALLGFGIVALRVRATAVRRRTP